MAAYSTQFFSGSAVSGGALYEVPTGYIAVVKYITCQVESSALDQPFFYDNSTGAPIWYGQPTSSPTELQSAFLQVVLVAGGVIFFTSALGGSFVVTVSGYLLAAM